VGLRNEKDRKNGPLWRFRTSPGMDPVERSRTPEPSRTTFYRAGSLALHLPFAVRLGALSAFSGIVCANSLSNLPEPRSCPGKLQAKNREADRNEDQSGARRDDHDNTEQQYRTADDRHGDAPGDFVGRLYHVRACCLLPPVTQYRSMKTCVVLTTCFFGPIS